MSRLMHLTALLLSLLVSGQSVASVGEGWICNATGTPMPGCPCSAPHTDGGGHPDEDGFASSACCERIGLASEDPAPVTPASSTSLSFQKALPPWPVVASPATAPVAVGDHRVRTPDRPTSSGPPVYLQLRHLLI
ncbi:MAG TPA: hypothetical protein VK013_04270 [Myxococcaceae bacterium]|nr:hypothetical protein [Myxococcaceae bacterium]